MSMYPYYQPEVAQQPVSSHDHGNCELCDEIEARLRAVEEEHKDVEWWSVWALEHDWLPPHDAQRLTAEVARLRTRSALQAADYTALETRERALVETLEGIANRGEGPWEISSSELARRALPPAPRQEG